MIKLLCIKCKAIWYTANTLKEQLCQCCNNVLIEVDISGDMNDKNNGGNDK
jgi:hypothetical protein